MIITLKSMLFIPDMEFLQLIYKFAKNGNSGIKSLWNSNEIPLRKHRQELSPLLYIVIMWEDN